ncbi:MAG: ATP-binding protein [Candidatus Sericytochromatia bacterium]
MKTLLFGSAKQRISTWLLLLGLIVTLGLSAYSLVAGYQMVGKTFAGFGMEFSFIVFPVDSQEWTGSKADFEYYEQIQKVDGKTMRNSAAFREYIQGLAPKTPVIYTVIRNSKPVGVTIPTMVFSLTDYFRIYVISSLVALFYAGLTLFILYRRSRIQQANILLFLTYSFTTVYALHASYNYLHQFVPLALLGYCAFPLSLFLLGTHLAKAGQGSESLSILEKLNLLVGSATGLTLAGLAAYIGDSPFSHQAAFALFVGIYQYLIAYYLLNFLAFIGLVLRRSLQRHKDELKNWQARIILVGTLVSFLPYLVMVGAFWVFRMPWSLPSELAVINTYLFILFVAYAILQDEGAALEVVFKKTVFYYMLVFLFGIAYVVVNRVVTVSIEASFLSLSKDVIPFIAGFVAFVLVSSFNSRLQSWVAAVFYRQRKYLKTLLETFIQDSTSTLDPQRMVGLGLRFLQQAFSPQNLALYLSPNLQVAGPTAYSRYFDEKAAYPEKLVLDVPLSTPGQIQEFKRRFGLHKEVVLPLHKNELLLGLFILDKKNSGLGYFAEDLELLKSFAFYFVTGFYIACQSQKSLAAQEKTDAAKRMEVLGTLAGGVAHDFNNLLSTIVMSVGLMKYLSEDPEIMARLQVIQHSAEKGAEITRALSDYASTLPPDQAVEIAELLSELGEQLEARLPQEISLHITPPPENFLILADHEQLLRALLELARNAQIAMNGKGSLTVEVFTAGKLETEPFAADEQEFLCIRIGDTGEGIPESIRHRIFDPFFSAWSEGKGIGLGLSIARQVIKNHNGQLEFESSEGTGSSFSVYLPLASQSLLPSVPEPGQTPQQLPQQSLILLIDDEQALRRLLAEALSHEGYAVIDAGNGQQGLNLFQEHHQELMLVVCDLEMPRFNGREFIAAARKIDPDKQIIVSTGHLSKADEKAFRQQGLQVLRKPYTVEQLLALVQQLHSRV